MLRVARVRAFACLSIVIAIGACAVGSDPELFPEDASDAGRIDTGTNPLPTGDSGIDPTDGPAGDSKTDSPSGDPCSVALAKLTYDFEAGAQGWTHGVSDGADSSGVSWPYDPWLTGTATLTPSCKSGNCFGTELTKRYAQCQRGYLQSPALDLSACTGKTVALVFHHAHQFWTGSYGGTLWFDGGVVEASANGTAWLATAGATSGTVKINPDQTVSFACVLKNSFGVHNKQGFVGTLSTTTRAELTLPAAAISSTTRIRFSFASGVSTQTANPDTSRAGTGPGWRVDDVGFVMK